MTFEAAGLYLAMLCEEWESGSIPADESVLRRLYGSRCSGWEDSFAQVRPCFDEVDGRLTNKRMEHERGTANKLSSQAALAGKARWRRKSDADAQRPHSVSSATAERPLSDRYAPVLPEQDSTGQDKTGQEKKREPRAPRAAAAPLPSCGPDVKHEDRQKFIGFWLTQFEKSTGRPYGPIGAKDAGQVTQILRLARGDVAEACSRTMILLNAAPDWIGRGGVDLGSLLTHWNKLVSAGQVGILTGAKAVAIASVNAPVAPLPGLLDYRKKPAPLGLAQ